MDDFIPQSPLALTASRKLRASSIRAGTWQPHFDLGLLPGAALVSLYVEAALAGIPHDELTGIHEAARAQLTQWGFITEARESIYPLTESGHDADIFAACGVSSKFCD